MKEIILCKTKIKDSMSEVNTRWYKEYAVFVDLTNDDVNHYSSQPFGMKELYNWNNPVITASRKVTLTGENRIDGKWILYDAFENIESASMGFGDSDYWLNVESVNALHSQAVEKNNKIQSLRKEYEGLEDLIKKTWLRESTKLKDKYNDLYADELKKKKLYSKAKNGNVPQNVIDEITSRLKPLYENELSQIENRMTEIKKELSEI